MSKPSKTSRRANAAAAAGKAVKVKDDGRRFTVINAVTGDTVYPGQGVPKDEAIRLAEGLVAPSAVREVTAAE